MTITEIAREAGVSIGTVDRIIHKRGHVSEAKRKSIESVIEKYGYQPNPIAKHLKMNKPFLIGILIPHLKSENGYWNMIYDGIEKAASELSPFSVKTVLSEFDRSKDGGMLASYQKLLESKFDALIIAPVQPFETLEIASNLAKLSSEPEKHIPYIFVDSPQPDAQPSATVAQNPYKSGFCGGRMMSLLCPNAKKLLTIQMHEFTYNLKERARGFSDFFKTNNNEKQTQPEIFNFTKKNSRGDLDGLNEKSGQMNGDSTDSDNTGFLMQIFKECPDADGIFVTNDAVCSVADFWAKNANKDSRRPKIVGYDLLPQNRIALADGKIDCLISQNPVQQGYEAVHILYRKELLLQEPETEVSISINTFFKENI